MCGFHYTQLILGYYSLCGAHEHMYITKDLNMDGVCEWLDPQVLHIWLVDAPMKNYAKDEMKEKLFFVV